MPRRILALSVLFVAFGCSGKELDAGEGDGGEGSEGVDPTLDTSASGDAEGSGSNEAGETSVTAGSATSGSEGGSGEEAGSQGEGSTGDSGGDSTTMASTTDGGSSGGSESGGTEECVIATCEGKTYKCGNCLDDDEDGLVDSADPDCWGPCQNNEEGWYGDIPGQNEAPCKMDCYFDGDSGSGNDQCYWSHECDMLEPQDGCNYDQNASIAGTEMTCAEAQADQGPLCDTVCGPVTPNGCDCFGCCDVTVGETTYTVFIGTTVDDVGTCDLENVADPEKCAPCTQVAGCLNDCSPEECEICIGQTEVPDGCEQAGCPDDVPSCDPNMPGDCGQGFTCVTGCCYPVPQ